MKQIVAARIGDTITNSPRKIAEAVKSGRIGEFIDRGRVAIMAACDFGPQWAALATGPTLFCIDDAGNVFDKDGK